MHPEPHQTVSLAPSLQGWRVVYLRSSAPWVEEHPIACWSLRTDVRNELTIVDPMILEKKGRWLEEPDEKREYRISRPGESPERWVEEAKEIQRRKRREARRKKRREKQRGSAPPKPKAPRDRPPRVSVPAARRTRRLDAVERARSDATFFMFGDRIVKAEGADVLCDFLELGCRFGKRQTASATALNEMYQEWCRALAVVPLDRGAVTRVLKEVGLEGEKRGARYELWKGIALQDVEPPAPPVDTSPEAKQQQRSLLREYVRRELRVAPWGSANTEMVFACYRAWCRQRSIQPANRNELSKVLKQMPGISPQKMPDGNTRWNNLDAKWPEAAGWKR